MVKPITEGIIETLFAGCIQAETVLESVTGALKWKLAFK